MPWEETTSAAGTPTAAPAGGNERDDSGSGSSRSSTTTIGLGVGLGVGIPLAVAVAGAIWFFNRRSRRNQGPQTPGVGGPEYDEGHKSGGEYPSQMAPASGYSPAPQGQQLSRIGGSPKLAVYEGMAPQEMPAQSPLPTEMASTPSERPRSELPS